ncbi:hypothetical protein BVRB_034620, partial [Beta vulgaris subsp. vulgaris]
ESSTDRLKRCIKLYGPTAIACHIGLSLTSLAGWYGVVSYGVDVVHILEQFGVPESSIASNTGTFALAYLIHKMTVPVRVPLTLAATPYFAKYAPKFLQK